MFWSVLNKAVQKKKLGFPQYNWGEEIFIPVDLWEELFESEIINLMHDQCMPSQEDKYSLLASMMTICAWRFTQGVYTVNESLYQQFFRVTPGGLLSTSHIHRMQEWSVYIQCFGASLSNLHIAGFFVHKTNIKSLGNRKEVNALILTFNILNPFKAQAFKIMPFVIFDATRNGTPAEQIISSNIFNKTNSIDELNQFLAPYFSLFNFVFDESTVIESDIVGPQQSHHIRASHHFNFNSFNIANFKYSAPSNTRAWNAGLNYIVDENKLKRSSNSESIIPTQWAIYNGEIQIKKASL